MTIFLLTNALSRLQATRQRTIGRGRSYAPRHDENHIDEKSLQPHDRTEPKQCRVILLFERNTHAGNDTGKFERARGYHHAHPAAL